ncbi:hypothetical protein B9479_005862, partial [Cryptococcus floricola]
MCSHFSQYVTYTLVRYIDALVEQKEEDWGALRAYLIEAYPDRSKHVVAGFADMQAFVDKWKMRPIVTREEVTEREKDLTLIESGIRRTRPLSQVSHDLDAMVFQSTFPDQMYELRADLKQAG